MKVVENRMHNPSPSYDELLAKIKLLEDERDSLLTALRLLRDEACSATNFNPGPSQQDQPSSPQWQTVVKKKTQGKHYNMSNKPPKPAQTDRIVIIGDSMTKYIQGDKLARNHNVKSMSFSGATVEDTNDFIKPVLRRKPQKVILHVGTNNVRNDNAKKIKQKLVKLVDDIKKDNPSLDIGISSIIHRGDDLSLNSKIDQVNCQIETYCEEKHFGFINNDNVNVEHCLNRSGVHLNRKGTSILVSNFKKFIGKE